MSAEVHSQCLNTFTVLMVITHRQLWTQELMTDMYFLTMKVFHYVLDARVYQRWYSLQVPVGRIYVELSVRQYTLSKPPSWRMYNVGLL